MYYVFAKKVKFPWTLYHKVHWWNGIRFFIANDMRCPFLNYSKRIFAEQEQDQGKNIG